MNHQIQRTAKRLSALILSFALTGGAASAAELGNLADDPRVVDAVALWSEWLERKYWRHP